MVPVLVVFVELYIDDDDDVVGLQLLAATRLLSFGCVFA